MLSAPDVSHRAHFKVIGPKGLLIKFDFINFNVVTITEVIVEF